MLARWSTLAWCFLPLGFTVACSGCNKKSNVDSQGASVSASASAEAVPSASTPPPPEPLPERRPLAERGEIDRATLAAKRKEVVAALDAARKLLEDEKSEDALEALSPALAGDPGGGAVALVESRAALAAGQGARALLAARRAVAASLGHDTLAASALVALAKALEAAKEPGQALVAYQAALQLDKRAVKVQQAIKTLEKAGASPADPQPLVAEAADLEAVCPKIKEWFSGDAIPVLVAADAKGHEVTCAPATELKLAAPTLARAVSLEVRASGSSSPDTQQFVFVALETTKGWRVTGPLATVRSAWGSALVSDVAADLQKIDVVPGGAPEVVVKLTLRRSLVDVALNELTEADSTEVLLLSLDRGDPAVSTRLHLSENVARSALDSTLKGMPKGFKRAPKSGSKRSYSVKVAWSGANAITLSEGSGSSKPPRLGQITLFE